jgi:hypothetical protein
MYHRQPAPHRVSRDATAERVFNRRQINPKLFVEIGHPIPDNALFNATLIQRRARRGTRPSHGRSRRLLQPRPPAGVASPHRRSLSLRYPPGEARGCKHRCASCALKPRARSVALPNAVLFVPFSNPRTHSQTKQNSHAFCHSANDETREKTKPAAPASATKPAPFVTKNRVAAAATKHRPKTGGTTIAPPLALRFPSLHATIQ